MKYYHCSTHSPTMIKCIIIDDDIVSSKILEQYIKLSDEVELVGVFNCPELAYRYLEKSNIDLLFLDIEMPAFSGIELLDKLGEKVPLTIITSSHSNYAVEAYKYPVSGYLLKPLLKTDFHDALEKAKQLLQIQPQSGDFLEFQTARRYFKILKAQLLFVEAHKDYMALHTSTGTEIVHITMKKLEKLLEGLSFYRANKSFLVNIKHVDKVVSNTIFIKGHKVPLGGVYKKAFLEKLVTSNA
jgi:DNA-binding LytR/AlgR family response regulator